MNSHLDDTHFQLLLFSWLVSITPLFEISYYGFVSNETDTIEPFNLAVVTRAKWRGWGQPAMGPSHQLLATKCLPFQRLMGRKLMVLLLNNFIVHKPKKFSCI